MTTHDNSCNNFRFYVTADIVGETRCNVIGYYVRYDNDRVLSYFPAKRRNIYKALAQANKLRDEMNEREKTESFSL